MRRLSSDERRLVGVDNVGHSPAPARTTLTGDRAFLRGTGFSPELRLPVIVSPPVRECWPELGADVEAVFRRMRARRRWQCRPLACSGEDNPYGSWCLPPANGLLTGVAFSGNILSSCGPMLAGAGRGCGGCPPTNEGSSEVATSAARLLRRRQPLSEVVPSSGERLSRRSWASGNILSSCGPMLAGAGRGCGGCPPTNEGSSEVATSAARLLRRGQPLRELGLSSGERASHRSWASGNSLSSCERMLAGAGRGCAGCPPTNKGSSEVATSADRLLRRRQPLSEVVPSSGERLSRRSWASGNLISSCERMLVGAGRGCGSCPPTNKRSSEVTISYARLLRRRQPLKELVLSSGERVSHRSWAAGNNLSSCERMLAGAGRGCGGCPPTNEGSSEVATSAARLLRRGQPS